MRKAFIFFAVLVLMSAAFARGMAIAADNSIEPMQGGMMDDSMMGQMGGMGGYGGVCTSCMRGAMRGGMLMRGGNRWGMHEEVEHGMMMGGLSGMDITPMLKAEFMKAIMKNMIRNALQDPEIKGFLDSTATLRKDLVMKEFEYFEAFRNPATTPEELATLKSGIRDIKIKIRAKMKEMAPSRGQMMR